VLCITKSQNDLLNKKFLLHIDCKSAKEILHKDGQNIASKHIFFPMTSYIKYFFYFDIKYIKGDINFIFDFLTR
jgi:hypothetical protein